MHKKFLKDISFSRLYECASCAGCPFAKDYKKSNDNNRIIMINQMLDAYKDQARLNLKSEKGPGKNQK